MPIDGARARYSELINTVGRAAISALYPHDIEVYLMALELTDGNGDTIDYLAFPILPDSISKSEPTRTTIKKTSGGITVLTSNSFVPQDIQIKGNFGRHFKILLSPKPPRSSNAVAFSTNRGVFDLTEVNSGNSTLRFSVPFFNIGVKTGYGAIRILKAIINKSNGVDADGRPFRLYFYNLALGESYLVTVPPSGITVNQSLEKNMIWGYTLNLTALAPLNALRNQSGASSLARVLTTSLIQQGINTASRDLVNIVGDAIEDIDVDNLNNIGNTLIGARG